MMKRASAVPSIFAATIDDDSERSGEQDALPQVAPIPLPHSNYDDAPLLDAMKRTREDPAKFEEYIKSRPRELAPTDEAFTKIPIEAFGRAMLEGMGYKEEEEDVVQPYLLDGRPTLLGLGAKAKPQDSVRNTNKRVYVVIGSLGQIEGTHRFAVVIQTDGVPGLDMIRVRTPGIASLGEDEKELKEVDLPKKKFLLITNVESLGESHPARRILAMNETLVAEDAKKADEAFNKRQRKTLLLDDDSNNKHWFRVGIRVLIVDEKDRDNYRKKGSIVRVDEEDGRCDVRLDKDPLMVVKRLKEKYLQTVVPDKPGSKLVVISGRQRRRRGEIAELVERNKITGKARLKFSDGEEESFEFDDICELADG